MLITGCIIGSLFTPTALEAGGRKDKKNQDIQGMDQLARKSKKKVNCSKKSKSITRNEITTIFTAETCDNWKYIQMSHTGVNGKLILNTPLDLKNDFRGKFENRTIHLGEEGCFSWVTGGKSDTFFLRLDTDVIAEGDTNTGPVIIIDTEIPVKEHRNMSVNQSARTCEWTFSFSDSGRKIGRLRFSESGKLTEESVKLTRAK